MHSYANEPSRRWKIIGLIALVCWPIHHYLSGTVSNLSQMAGIPLTVPSVLTVFYAAFWCFRHVLWRGLSWIGLLDVNDLNGTWEGTLRTSHGDNFDEEYPFTLHIEQEWTRISVEAQTESSRSESTSAFLESDQSGSELTYTYRNRPKPSSEEGMAAHEGTAKLRLKEEDRLVGRYYTGEGREQYGEIEVTRVS
ncbi:hypothetical protein GGQ00_003028 [Salinibacter ruber]|uniref:Cap15 family cyclic dinucleotide receptor domain-containing protein n=1 Tax=Salinibacter ruber TaxID=146919 RepID=UPI00216A8ABD|nr:hypothetical protein [Salinibacter ruber]MCS4044568.1 hypothetical protein [Salinibacter ruber]